MKVLAENLTIKTKCADEQGCSVRAAEPNQNWCVGCSPDNCSGFGTFYEIKKQRDELLAALELYLAHASEPECAIWRYVQQEARAAIESVKGEQL